MKIFKKSKLLLHSIFRRSKTIFHFINACNLSLLTIVNYAISKNYLFTFHSYLGPELYHNSWVQIFLFRIFLACVPYSKGFFTFCIFAGMLFHLLILSDRLTSDRPLHDRILHKINHAHVACIYFRTNTHTWRHIQRSLTLQFPFFFAFDL